MAEKKQLSEKVTHYLISLLERTDISVLPSVRDIAGNCGVSPSTVWKVLTKFQNEKLLVTRWGHEVAIRRKGDHIPHHNVKKTSKVKWERIRDLIKKEFLSDRATVNSHLPSLKELQKKYNVSYITIKKAIDTLATSGKILPDGAGYRICGTSLNRRWKPVVVIICAGNQPGIPKITTEREREFYQSLTIETNQAQLDLRYVIFNDWEKDPVFYLADNTSCIAPSDDNSVLGYIVSSWHMKDIHSCLSKLSGIYKPVSVWIESSFTPDLLATGKNRVFFNIGYSNRAGVDMAEHFLRLGHREIAYLSPFHRSSWSRERLKGLIETFAKQGPGYKVHPFTISKALNEWDYSDIVMKRGDLDRLFNLKAITEETENGLSRQLGIFKTEGIKLLRDTLILKSIKQPIESIVENQSITALVGANDLISLLSFDYLKYRGIKIPGRISLAGFDNSFEALVNGLTSYSFDTHSMVRSMVEHITGLTDPVKASELRYFNGTIIERATTSTNT